MFDVVENAGRFCRVGQEQRAFRRTKTGVRAQSGTLWQLPTREVGDAAMARKTCLSILSAAALTAALMGPAIARADKLSDAKQQAQSLQQKQEDTKKRIAQLASRERSLQQQLSAVQRQLDSLERSIDGLQTQIQQRNSEIEQLKARIAQTQAQLQHQYHMLQQRVRVMYETDHSSYLSVLFQSTSFSDFLSRLQVLSDIAKQNQQMLAQIEANKQQLDAQTEELKAKQAAQQRVYQSLLKKREEQKQKQAEEQKLLKQVHQSKVSAEKDLKDEQSALASIASAIEKMEAEQKRKAAEAKAHHQAMVRTSGQSKALRQSQASVAPQGSQSSQSSGQAHGSSSSAGSVSGWVWPVPSCHTISSGYGNRVLNGQQQFHPGIDIPGALGAPIVAATSGTVLYAGPASGYGNWIVTQSSDGLYEIYGHMTPGSILVSPGQHVQAGQHIANIGSEGESTGPHLHFEIATSLVGPNGLPVPTNPLNYVHP
jgi:septal ring factor EnvC (AmiA/AmiB activator)